MSDKMREEFEGWIRGKEQAWFPFSIGISRYEGGNYISDFTQFAWMSWQASRAAMAQEGWQLVPRIPTDAMKTAFHQADSDWEDGYAFDDQGNRHDSPVYQWIAMLNAAPKP